MLQCKRGPSVLPVSTWSKCIHPARSVRWGIAQEGAPRGAATRAGSFAEWHGLLSHPAEGLRAGATREDGGRDGGAAPAPALPEDRAVWPAAPLSCPCLVHGQGCIVAPSFQAWGKVPGRVQAFAWYCRMALLQVFHALGQNRIGLSAVGDLQAVASGPGEKGRATSSAAGAASAPAPLVPPPLRPPGSAEKGAPPSAARGPPSPPMSEPGAMLAADTPPGPALLARVGTLTLAGQSNGGAAAADRDRGQAGDVAGAEHGGKAPEAAVRARGAGATSSTLGTCRDLAERVEQLVGHEEAACCAVWSPSGRNAVTAAADGTRPALPCSSHHALPASRGQARAVPLRDASLGVRLMLKAQVYRSKQAPAG